MVTFLVKFPVYAAQIWLPKAHVEAPVSSARIQVWVKILRI